MDFLEKIIKDIGEHLENADYNYTFSDEEDCYKVGIALEECAVTNGVVRIIPTTDYIMFSTKIPIMIKEENMDAVAKTVTIINNQVIGGSFILSYNTGRVEFRSFVSCCNEFIPSKELIEEQILFGAMAFEAYGNAICKVGCGYASPEDALDENV